jgi:plasmid maintenance system antidote protein VapI
LGGHGARRNQRIILRFANGRTDVDRADHPKERIMRMKKLSHPGRLVKNLAEIWLAGLKVGEGLGLTRQELRQVVSRRSAISPEMALPHDEAIGGAAGARLRAQADHGFAQLRERVLSSACVATGLLTMALLSGCSAAPYPPCYGPPFPTSYPRYCQGLPTPYFDDPHAYAYSRW